LYSWFVRHALESSDLQTGSVHEIQGRTDALRRAVMMRLFKGGHFSPTDFGYTERTTIEVVLDKFVQLLHGENHHLRGIANFLNRG